MNTSLTQAAKEDLYIRCEYILKSIYYICGGKVLHMQLIKLLEEMNLPHMTQLKIKSDITELIKAGFLKKKQVLNTNANVLILTAYPLSVLQSVPSANVSEITSSRKSILEGMCRIEFIINELNKYRKINKTNAPFTVEKIVEFMDWRNSTVCYPLKNINLYLERICRKYDNLNVLSQDFLDDYHYLEVIRMQKANALSKTSTYDIDPEWLKVKEDHASLQETMSTELQNRSLYNIYNMKNSSCDINHWVIKEDGRYYIRINLYDNGNLDTRACITIVILNSVCDCSEKAIEKLQKNLSEDLNHAWKAAKKYKGKKVKPEKRKTKKSFFEKALENTQSQQLHN